MGRPPAWGRLPSMAAAAGIAVARGACTVREVAQACGWSSTSTAWAALRLAHHHGLVTWAEHPDGKLVTRSLRSTITITAHTPAAGAEQG